MQLFAFIFFIVLCIVFVRRERRRAAQEEEEEEKRKKMIRQFGSDSSTHAEKVYKDAQSENIVKNNLNQIFKILLLSVILPVSGFLLCYAFSTDENITTPSLTTPSDYSFDYDLSIFENLEIPEIDLPEKDLSRQTYKVTYTYRYLKNNKVGNKWTRGVEYNGRVIDKGEIVTLDNAILCLTVFACEDDERDDYGYEEIIFDRCSYVGQRKNQTVTVTVRENGGRYSGNTAKWEFVVTVERIS